MKGGPYGQFGNTAVSLVNARLYARRAGLKLAVLDMYPEIERLRSAFDAEDVLWNATRGQVNCVVVDTWGDVFFRKDEIRALYLDQYDAPPLARRYREEAEEAMRQYGDVFTVHGRSYENQCEFSAKHEHTPVPCREFTHNLCLDYRYTTVVSLFQLRGTPVLMTDRQSPVNDYSYYAQGGILDTHEFFVQLWMMAMSKHHVGSLGSSLDFMVWLWKRHHFNATCMHPAACYPISSHGRCEPHAVQ